MKKFCLLLLFTIAACEGAYVKNAAGREGDKVIMLPGGPYNIKSEKDYQQAKLACKSKAMRKNDQDNYCLNELRRERNFGSLQFLGEEKQQDIYIGH